MNKNQEKPKTTEAQVDSLWDMVYNHVLHQLEAHDVMLKAIVVIVTLTLMLVAVAIGAMALGN